MAKRNKEMVKRNKEMAKRNKEMAKRNKLVECQLGMVGIVIRMATTNLQLLVK